MLAVIETTTARAEIIKRLETMSPRQITLVAHFLELLDESAERNGVNEIQTSNGQYLQTISNGAALETQTTETHTPNNDVFSADEETFIASMFEKDANLLIRLAA